MISSLLWLGGSICFLVDVAVDGTQWGLEMGGAVCFTAGSALMVLHALQIGWVCTMGLNPHLQMVVNRVVMEMMERVVNDWIPLLPSIGGGGAPTRRRSAFAPPKT